MILCGLYYEMNLRKNNGWNEEEFFSTGKQEIKAILDKAKELGFPKCYGTALDICCGIGRLTSNLVDHFAIVKT